MREVCVECPKLKEKKNWQTNYGNAIVEIEKKKFVIIVTMVLPKMEGKKMVVPKSGRVKKKYYIHNNFHNKSYVISYY